MRLTRLANAAALSATMAQGAALADDHGPVVDGKRHGTWVTDGAGYVETAQYAQNELHGQRTLKDAYGKVKVSATYRNGVATDVRLPMADVPQPTPDSGYAPITGAFGIELGPNLDSIKNVRCGLFGEGEPCFNEIVSEFFESAADDSQEAIIYVHAPAPMRGAEDYTIFVDYRIGISTLWADLALSPCEGEAERVQQLLRQKYGKCVDEDECDRRAYARCLVGDVRLTYRINRSKLANRQIDVGDL